MAYTAEEVDSIVSRLETCADRVTANKASVVKLRAAERDILAEAEGGRNLLLKAVKEDKNILKEVFGGTCERIGRLRKVLDEVDFTDMHNGDARWSDLRNACESIEAVLKELGLYKPWQPPKLQPPSNIRYKSCRSRFNPGEVVNMKIEFEGEEVTEFTVEPALPTGLELDSTTGNISGKIPLNSEVPETTYTVTVSNPAGQAAVDLTFSVLVESPGSVTYPSLQSECYVGQAIMWEPNVVGGLPTEWSVDSPLPRGLRLDASGAITGVPLEMRDADDYTISGSNPGGQATTCVRFEIQVAPPESLAYPDALPVYAVGEVIDLTPKLMLKDLGDESAVSKIVRAGAEQLDDSSLPPCSYCVDPTLPEGLVLNSLTGVISGSVQAPYEETLYKVSVSNHGGECSLDLPLSIKLSPPASLVYSSLEPRYFVGENFTLEPEIKGLVENWSISTSLPSGIDLDATSGTISGIPLLPTTEGEGPWTVTASNAAGSCSTSLPLCIVRAAPRDFEYPSTTSEFELLRFMEIKPNVKGEVDEYRISPDLPSGIEIDSATGRIYGTPTTVTEPMSFEITAENTTGSATTEITFQVKVMPPENLRYVGTDTLYTVGEDVSLSLEVEPPATTSFSVEPQLPVGMLLDSTSGYISGAPESLTAETTYEVTASNEAGTVKEDLTFAIVAPAPTGICYPALLSSYTINEPLLLEPEVEGGQCSDFRVSPSLPEGFEFDSATGAISGTPTTISEPEKYTITAKNERGAVSVDIEFSCDEPEEIEIDQGFAARIEEITEIAELMEEPSQEIHLGDWMIWMVHRAHLNDPTLVDFDFGNKTMPYPHLEPRIAPKLMEAMKTNTNIKSLTLNNANMQKPQGHELADALKVNTTLEKLNVETNNLDSDSIKAMAEGLQDNKASAMEQWRFGYQKGVGGFFGRPVEEAIGQLMEKNDRITKLGFSCNDAHWRNSIDRAILRNIDFARRRRRKGTDEADEVVAEEKSLSTLVLRRPPEKAISTFFDEEDANLKIIRGYIANTKKLPSHQQLQSFAKNNGTPLKYSIVAPLIKEFRTKILDSAVGTSVVVSDDYRVEMQGILRAWSEKNENWRLDIWPEDGGRYNFVAAKQPVLEVSEDFATWLSPAD